MRRLGRRPETRGFRTALPPRLLSAERQRRRKAVPVLEDVAHEWVAMQSADDVLNEAVEHMRERYGLAKDTATIVAQIKRTMRVRLPSGPTVFQALHAREQQTGFNDNSLGWRVLS